MNLLRAIEPEDLDLMYILENDTSLWSCGDSTVPYSYHTLRQYLQNSSNNIYTDGQVRLAIGDAGFIDLTDFDPRNSRAQVGIVVAPSSQHQGVGTAALLEIQQYARVNNIHQLYAVVSTRNIPAMKLFRKAGFVPSGTLQEWVCVEGDYVDAVFFQLVL